MIPCILEPLSKYIRDYDVQRIDFLKIDAEKSELDVLLGIEEDDWSKVQQIFIEVHNRDNRVAEIVDMLKRYDFSTIVTEQDDFFADTEIWALYAKR